ncbi:hypothetical protein [Streptomyces hainanensis]|uniref:Uncharacterized protein n=1 Tax=Streptomyces hainanensis TaxID=402648 RepID=A0A4R4TUE7_9ACTN|nr:hypothetical protein [Streptomyces hainanensis]TDC80426.1 hypothetical protein E1283_00375 [Streptomyces hainanensis]
MTDPRPLRTAQHEVARAATVTVSDVVEAGLHQTYHSVTVSSCAAREVTVLCHRHLPWVAFADPGRHQAFTPWFVQPPPWAEHFTWCGFTVLDLGFLLAPVAGADLSALGRVEREQVGYGKPRVIGEIAFNRWD